MMFNQCKLSRPQSGPSTPLVRPSLNHHVSKAEPQMPTAHLIRQIVLRRSCRVRVSWSRRLTLIVYTMVYHPFLGCLFSFLFISGCLESSSDHLPPSVHQSFRTLPCSSILESVDHVGRSRSPTLSQIFEDFSDLVRRNPTIITSS